MGTTPQQGWMAAESRELAHADFNQDDREIPREDHFAHAPGKICKGLRAHDRTRAGRSPEGRGRLGARCLPAISG
jgi:hypothetical protein